jgi:hypothetical protein
LQLLGLRSLLLTDERVDAETGVAVGYTFWFGAAPALVVTALAWVVMHIAIAYAWIAVIVLGPIGVRLPVAAFVVCLDLALVLMLAAASHGLLVMGTSRYVLTNLRVISRTGILSRRLQRVELRRVSGVYVSRSLMGRLLRYGHVSIDSGGVAGVVVMRFVPGPEAWASRIRGAQRSHVPVTSAYENTPA